MCDVRKSTSEEMLEVFNKFKKSKPEVKWYEERPCLFFKIGRKELRINYIYLPHGSLSCEFYTGVDNIRFDGTIKITKDIEKEISNFIKNGISKSVLDYI